ncbi:hypothetical protein [Streptomyces sp. SID14478]|uniref:hypothetical protein n=1 Tax=Streptomyces sp. SID14478 TaxID=2706073 RepID=UPI001941C7BF|nr:hypothetical protein [Streptomyces sp. SID14478]
MSVSHEGAAGAERPARELNDRIRVLMAGGGRLSEAQRQEYEQLIAAWAQAVQEEG